MADEQGKVIHACARDSAVAGHSNRSRPDDFSSRGQKSGSEQPGHSPERQSVVVCCKRNSAKPVEGLPNYASRRHLACCTRVLFLALGDTAPPEQFGPCVSLRFVPHLKNLADVAGYFQAADVYLHAAAADTFPRAVLEALACGTPVVGTNVGGIPEQLRSLETDKPTGILVAPGDPESMALAIEKLLTDEPLRQTLAANAVADARERFDVVKQAHSYLQWYTELLNLQADRHARIINQAYKMSALS